MNYTSLCSELIKKGLRGGPHRVAVFHMLWTHCLGGIICLIKIPTKTKQRFATKKERNKSIQSISMVKRGLQYKNQSLRDCWQRLDSDFEIFASLGRTT